MIQFICFSRRRPLQLHGYLSSLFERCPEGVAVSVLYRADPDYGEAYDALREVFPYVFFLAEHDFAADLKLILDRSSGEYISFGCDDAVFIHRVVPEYVEAAFNRDQLIGLSLRLGWNTTRGMFGQFEPPPRMIHQDPLLVWDVNQPDSMGDWAYPWEVLGTIYPAPYVRKMVRVIQPGSPNQLEERGTHCWSEHTTARYMSAFQTPRLVVPTVNIVQTDFPGNGIKGSGELSTDFLLKCWQLGLRLDTTKFSGLVTDSWRVPDFYMRRAA